jgi:RNA polymerase sigma-70 factor (ECF subfamily)
MDPAVIDQLVGKAQMNDTEAFRELVEHTEKFAHGTVYRITGNREDSRDIVQEAYLRMWKNLRSYNGRFPFTTWFRRILRNLAIDWLRRQKGRPANMDEMIYAGPASDSTNPGSVLENSQLTAIIRQWVPTLPRTQQQVFIMRDIEDLSVREVQQESGLSESAVKTNLYHARKKLRIHLIKYGYR